MTAALAGSAVRPPAAVGSGSDHVFHQYVVTTEARDELRAHLTARGVATAVHYPTPIHRTEAYAALTPSRWGLAESEWLSSRICSLPMHPAMTSEDVARIAAAIHELEPLAEAA